MLQAYYGRKYFLAFPQRGLDEAEETEVVHYLPQTTLQVLTCQCQGGLEPQLCALALSLSELTRIRAWTQATEQRILHI